MRLNPFDKPIKSLYFRSFVVSVLFARFHFKVLWKSLYGCLFTLCVRTRTMWLYCKIFQIQFLFFWPNLDFNWNVCNRIEYLGSLLTLFLFFLTFLVYHGRVGDLGDFYTLVVILFGVSFHLINFKSMRSKFCSGSLWIYSKTHCNALFFKNL